MRCVSPIRPFKPTPSPSLFPKNQDQYAGDLRGSFGSSAPPQDVSVSGGIVHAHTRDPFLASLPKEALEALARSYDEIVAKYIPDASQNGPQNQVNSSTAIEAEVVESEASNA